MKARVRSHTQQKADMTAHVCNLTLGGRGVRMGGKVILNYIELEADLEYMKPCVQNNEKELI